MKFLRHKKMQRSIVFLSICISVLCLQTKAQAPDSSNKYKLFLEPYIMFTSMSGTTGIGNLPNAFICVPAGEVFSYLNMGGMLYAELHNNKFAFTSDLFYASLDQDASGKNSVLNGKASIKQFLWELEALYKLSPWLEAGIGARINSIQVGLNLNLAGPGGGTANATQNKTNTWVDPLIIARAKTWINNKWLLSLRADIGGFGVGSQFAWQLQPDIAYRVSKLLQLGIGYRAISMDYHNKKSGADRFVFDMDEYGPQVRIGFNF
jgi:hypothetical protein